MNKCCMTSWSSTVYVGGMTKTPNIKKYHQRNCSKTTVAQGSSGWTVHVWALHFSSRLCQFYPIIPLHKLPAGRIGRLTFVKHSEDDLSVAAVHIWTVPHLADVGAIEGRRHSIEGDGNIFSGNVPWPLHVIFKTPFTRGVRHLMVVEELTNKHARQQEYARAHTAWTIICTHPTVFNSIIQNWKVTSQGVCFGRYRTNIRYK